MTATDFESLVSWAIENCLALFPIPAGCKTPTGIVASHAKDYSRDPERWQMWRSENPDCNFGVECGPSNLIVVDIDVVDGKPQTEAFQTWWRGMVGDAPPPPTVKTPTGGAHLYFRVSAFEGAAITRQPGLARHVDVRAGNAYVVAPYSVTSVGADSGVKADGIYVLVGAINDAPPALLDHCSAQPSGSPIVRREVDLAYDGYPVDEVKRELVQARVNRGLSAARKCKDGDRNNGLFRSSASLGAYVASGWLDKAMAEGMLTEAGASVGLQTEEIERTIRSGFKAAAEKGSRDFVDPADTFADVQHVDTAVPPIAPSAAGPRLPRLKTVGEFCAAYEPPTYILDPMVRSSSIYTLTAATGTGKTAFLVAASLAIASGRRELVGIGITMGRVAYCCFENPDDVRQRFIVSASKYDVNLASLADSLVVLDFQCRPEQILAALTGASTDGGFALIVVDTLQAAFDGGDSNHNVEAGNFIRRLRHLTTDLPGHPAVIIAAHPTKGLGDNLVPYGAGAILNEVDGNLTLSKDGEVVRLHWHGKLRGNDFKKVPYRFEAHQCPDLLDSKGRPVVIPVLQPVTAADSAFGPPLDTAKMRVLRAMVEKPDGPQREWATMARAVADLSESGFPI